jgi:hypothetical protein
MPFSSAAFPPCRRCLCCFHIFFSFTLAVSLLPRDVFAAGAAALIAPDVEQFMARRVASVGAYASEALRRAARAARYVDARESAARVKSARSAAVSDAYAAIIEVCRRRWSPPRSSAAMPTLIFIFYYDYFLSITLMPISPMIFFVF